MHDVIIEMSVSFAKQHNVIYYTLFYVLKVV